MPLYEIQPDELVPFSPQPADQQTLSPRSRIRRALLEAIPTSSAAYRRHEARVARGGDYEASASRAMRAPCPT